MNIRSRVAHIIVIFVVSTMTIGCTTLMSSKSATRQDSYYYNCSNPTGCLPVLSDPPKSNITQTKYPIVLVHGLGGWNSLFGFIEYFNGIPEALIEGGSEVYVTQTSAIHNAEYRGEQLKRQVSLITAVTGQDKVNLIGHSLGGVDIRYVAAVAPHQVASVTAVASPEQGSRMADWVVDSVTKSSADDAYEVGAFNRSGKAMIAFFKFVGHFMDVGSGITRAELQAQDSFASANSLTTSYMTDQFNIKYSAALPSYYCGYPPKNYVVNGVAYYSFSGIGTVTNKADPSDYMLNLTSKAFGNDSNDGLVSQCSSRLGYVIRDDYRMNHLDSINQVMGLTASNEVNPLTVYRSQVSRLKLAGF